MATRKGRSGRRVDEHVIMYEAGRGEGERESHGAFVRVFERGVKGMLLSKARAPSDWMNGWCGWAARRDLHAGPLQDAHTT